MPPAHPRPYHDSVVPFFALLFFFLVILALFVAVICRRPGRKEQERISVIARYHTNAPLVVTEDHTNKRRVRRRFGNVSGFGRENAVLNMV
jgi:hypothetical protein